MWTPRRVLLLVVGAVVFGGAFVVYNNYLGWIDGLPTLPERFLPARGGIYFDPTPLPLDNRILRLLRQAFGDGCAEVNYPIRLNVQSQGQLLATENIDPQPDGRYKLTPFSLALLGKVNPETGYPEINTIHCDVAYIEFDRPVASFSDIGRSKMVAAEFIADKNALSDDPRKGWVHVVHNHATPQTDDDAVMTTPGPFYFRDASVQRPGKPQLWTHAYVDITDYQSQPPHIIKAQGMNVFLAEGAMKSGERKAAKDAKDVKPAPQPVKAIEFTNVQMILTLEDESSFGGPAETAPARKLTPDEKPLLSIRTLGMFHYDLPEDKAWFEIAPPTDSSIPQYVEVVRSSKKNGNDLVQCDRLDLQFAHKATGPASPAAPRSEPAPASERSGSLAVEEARATGKLVILTSDLERLHARGTELIHSKPRSQSVLRGSPMSAVKEGHRIQARELVLNQIDKKTLLPTAPPVRQATAQGPGTVWLYDPDNQRTVEVTWNDQLTIDKERDLDRITLTGGARFLDAEREQMLKGNQIKLWMAPDPNAPPAKPGQSNSDTARGKLQRMHVIGEVGADSPDLKIHDTDLLVVWFTDVPALPSATVGPVRESEPKAAATSAPPAPIPGLEPPRAAAQPVAAAPAAGNAPEPAAPPKRPMVVSARIVEAFILRAGSKNELDKVKCFERVVVHQDPERPAERGLDIVSKTLEMTRTPDGDILKLTGPLSRVDTHEMSIVGPQVLFDQKENRANVDGAGWMRMLTSSTLKGEQRAKPSEIEVYWNDKMNFVGAFASFVGGVQATQENTRVLCPRMDVYFDRTVSLRRAAGDRGGIAGLGPTPAAPRPTKGEPTEQAKVSKVICHQDGQANAARVIVTEVVMQDGKLARYQRIESPEVTFDNDEGKMKAGGYGEVRILQPGEKTGDPFAKPDPKTSAAPEQEMQLTRIRFDDRMESNDKIKTAHFFKNVRVVHMPATDPNAVVDENSLAPGAMLLRSDRLQVVSVEDRGKSYPSMLAEGHAEVASREFSGQADTIKYDEGADKNQKVIFESTGSAPALLSRMEKRGQKPDEILGKTIIYWRKTNAYKVAGAYYLNGAPG